MSEDRDMTAVKDILVVDDSRTELVFLKGVLSRHGYHVRTAENADQAMRELGQQLPDLILMDVVMPSSSPDPWRATPSSARCRW